jgi:hypothetical protein
MADSEVTTRDAWPTGRVPPVTGYARGFGPGITPSAGSCRPSREAP